MRIVFASHEDLNNVAVARAMMEDVAKEFSREHKVTVFCASSEAKSEERKGDILYKYFRRKTRGKILFSEILELLGSYHRLVKVMVHADIVFFRAYPIALVSLPIVFLTKAKIVLDTRGVWFEELFDSGKLSKSRLLKAFFFTMERLLLSTADKVICVTSSQRAYYATIMGRKGAAEKCIVSPNGAPRPKQVTMPNSKIPTVGYVGSLIDWHLPKRTADILRNMQEMGQKFEFHCVTNDFERAKKIFGEIDNKKIYSHPYREKPIRFDLGLCLIANTLSKKVCFPVKFAEYLASGTYPVVSKNVVVCRRFVEKAQFGVLVDLQKNDQAIAAELCSILGSFDKNDSNILSLPDNLSFDYQLCQLRAIIREFE